MTTASEIYLLRRLDLLRARVRVVVAGRRADDPEADDRFRGLYITDDEAARVLDDRPPFCADLDEVDRERLLLEAWADDREADGETVRLRAVARSFGLLPLDVEILLAAIGPDLDPRLERAFGYLHDDVTRRRASVGLAIELCGADPFDPTARARYGPLAPLVADHLLEVEEFERPFLTRALRVPDPVASFLLGDDATDPVIEHLITVTSRMTTFDTSELVRALRSGIRLFYVRDRVGAAALSFAAAGAAAGGLPVLALDLDRLAASDDVAIIAAAASRQARLSGSALIVGPVEVLGERNAQAVRSFSETGGVAILIGSRTWDPLWSRTPPVVVDAPDIPQLFAERLPFRLTPEQADRAREAAHHQAVSEGVETTLEHLAAGARAQNAGGLERLSLRISPRSGWDDLVLPDAVLQQLHELVARVRYRDQVLTGWGLKRGSAKGQGVTALFSGDSGTGKTLAAEVLAGALGLDLYVVDLATVVDKYIGETEKNLDRIFREADRVNGVLLFDEADAIFGKRSDVQDARDRYANVEVAYLLQRMERFDGIAILTTNLRANIDDAFLRRIDTLVDFPVPTEEMRRLLWERHLPESMPRDDTVDVAFLARAFDLSGGNIRNIALAAAFLSAADHAALSMASLIKATAREYRKLGRLTVEHEFGQYHSLLTM
ncbi:MAG: ATP-binding protein, partial [Ilumatobacteraceae bacterium]